MIAGQELANGYVLFEARHEGEAHAAFWAEWAAEHGAVLFQHLIDLSNAARDLGNEAAGSVEYSDWPELQQAIERVRELTIYNPAAEDEE